MTTNSIFTYQQVGRAVVRFVQGTDAPATPKTLYTAGATNSGTLGSKVYAPIAVSSDGTSAHLITMLLINGGTTYELNSINVPLNSGNASGVPPVSIMALANWPGLAVDSNGNPYIPINNGDTVDVQYATSLTSGTTLTIYAAVADA